MDNGVESGATSGGATPTPPEVIIAPAYPGFEVEALRDDPSPIEALTIPAITEHFEAVMDEFDSPPIIIGHSAGGLITQILLDHGYGAAGVAIDSVPAEGIRVSPVSQIRAIFPNFRRRHGGLLRSP